MTVGELLRRTTKVSAERIAVIDSGRLITYAEFNVRVNRFANGMLGLGVQRGDRVAVQMDNRVEALEIFAACAKVGAVYLPLDGRTPTAQTEALLADSQAAMLVTDKDHRPVSPPELPSTRVLVVGAYGEPEGSYEMVLASASGDEPDVTAEPDDIVCLVYTSGTTGRPKGVCTTHRQMTAYLHVPLEEYELDQDSRYLVLYPHSSSAVTNSIIVPAWACGSAVVLEDVRDITADQIMTVIQRHEVTHLGAVPAMLARILELLADTERRSMYDLSSLVTIWYGSTPMAPAMAERLLRVLGPVFVHVYGMTEFTGTATTLGKHEHERIASGEADHIASCGRPVSGVELEIVDDADLPLPPGAVGEIRLRSESMMLGYWRDPDRTAEAIRGGWLYTGDLGRQDESGYVYIVDRKKDLIVRNGEHIASKEIEDALHVHEAVLEAAAIGVPDEEAGEQIHAYVTLRSGSQASVDDIRAAALSSLAESKMPQSITILDALPKNAVGKVQKAALREWQAAGSLTGSVPN